MRRCALVESQDLSIKSGRKLWNRLLDLRDEFDRSRQCKPKIKHEGGSRQTGNARHHTTQQGQASMFDTFVKRCAEARCGEKIVNDTFKHWQKPFLIAGAFTALAQSIDPATEAGQGLISRAGESQQRICLYPGHARRVQRWRLRNRRLMRHGRLRNRRLMRHRRRWTARPCNGPAHAPVSATWRNGGTLADKLAGLRDKLGFATARISASGVWPEQPARLAQQSQRCAWQSDKSAIDAAQLRLPGADVVRHPSGSRIGAVGSVAL